MKDRALGFSIVGSLVIVAFMVFVNYSTSPGFPWFIFPVFAVLWWPLGVYVARKGNARMMAVAGSLLATLFFIVVNLVTSPGFLWFIFPVFAVLWWPMAVFLGRKPRAFSVVSFLLTTGFFVVLNLMVSPGYLWFFHICYAMAWWPLSVFLANGRSIKLYSLAASLMTILYLGLTSFIASPGTPWFLYAVFPLLLWPAVMYSGRHAARVPFAIAGAVTGIAYYMMLNLFLSPGHPWILYLLLPFIWWPVTISFRKAADSILFLFISITIFMIYYGLLNIFVSPEHPWSVYLAYPYAWAAIGIYFGKRKMPLGLAVAGTIITILFFSILNLILTPGTIWAVYPVFAILWWPFSVYFFKTRKRRS